ncbi:hypothetical protein [Parerythrobacter jejuensis]|uniref:Uncharacterized protein n=1 Tax=Parerythrobacter jejuensis TaxID=795812 RepID=A0A845AZB3_9SPHN|nr:hypothetical protein [Parerythrobacter jejuensis]MXP31086.1 hypothetical protein [Parerythrobacter jejuensis]MXP33846.1 hypothetical protein [Parerythrobacter jejuensis]
MTGESGSRWKTFAVVIGAIAALLTAIGGLLTQIGAFYDEPDAGQGDAPTVMQPNPAPQNTAPVPSSPSQNALADKQALQMAEAQTTRIVDAIRRQDLGPIVALADPPVFLDQGTLVLSKADFRQRLRAMFKRNSGDAPMPRPDRIKAYSIGDARNQGFVAEGDRAISRLNLTNDDLIAIADFDGEAVAFYFRRKSDGIGLAAIWD